MRQRQVKQWGARLLASLLTVLVASSAVADEEIDRESELLSRSANVSEQDAFYERVISLDETVRQQRTASRLERMREQQGVVSELLKTARANNEDDAKLNCIKDKLINIKGLINVGEEASRKMTQAERSAGGGEVGADERTVASYYVIIATTYYQVNQAERDAQLCVGNASQITEEGASTVDEDDDIPDVDPNATIVDIDDIFGRIYDRFNLTGIR